MDLEKKIELATRKPTCEILTSEELRNVFETNNHPKHYIGFEVSGMAHLGTLVSTLKIKDLLEAGAKPTILLADYHAWINNKLGGDLKKIQEVAKGYFKHAFISMGLSEDKVKFELASELYGQEYWKMVMETSRHTTLKRMLRCVTIMGRKESEATDSAAVLYPAMQTADAFLLDVDIMHGGLDQRKAHVLAREISEKMKRKKPVALHHALLMGLQGPQKMGFEEREDADIAISSKMSKSKPETCIYIHDSEAEIKKKISKAYCPEKQFENNPIIELCTQVIMRDGSTLKVERPEKFGGTIEFEDADSVKLAYSEGKLHPMDLKNAVAAEISKILEPTRKYFEKKPELLEQAKKAEATR